MKLTQFMASVALCALATQASADPACDLKVTRDRNANYEVCYSAFGPTSKIYDVTDQGKMAELERCLVVVKTEYEFARHACTMDKDKR
jgi:hypothetical protein